MTIRIQRGALPSDGYTIIPKSYARDRRLSLDARGVLAWLLSLNAGATVTEETIVAAGPDGPEDVRRMIRELEENGYLQRVTVGLLTGYVLTSPGDGQGAA